ncbi:MAG: hypothetical protein ACRDJN_21015 [Chloroflexota bacterium]
MSLRPTAPARETARARQAWADYLALGPGRSLEGLLDRYQSAPKAPPTRRLKTLKAWSRAYGWQARLGELADREARAAEQAEAAYRRSIMAEGFGLAHERVKALKRLATALFQELVEGGCLWVMDTKGVGAGKQYREVPVAHFNAPEVAAFRGLLDDLARETGGRPRQVHVDVETHVRRLARQYGLDPDEAVAEAERVLRERRAGGAPGRGPDVAPSGGRATSRAAGPPVPWPDMIARVWDELGAADEGAA